MWKLQLLRVPTEPHCASPHRPSPPHPIIWKNGKSTNNKRNKVKSAKEGRARTYLRSVPEDSLTEPQNLFQRLAGYVKSTIRSEDYRLIERESCVFVRQEFLVGNEWLAVRLWRRGCYSEDGFCVCDDVSDDVSVAPS